MTAPAVAGKRGGDAGHTPSADVSARRSVVETWRLVAACLAIVLMVFAQRSGEVAADTKIDLVVTPGRFLARSLQLWDPLADGGRLQNQAYGYLFPIGPVFYSLHAIGVSAWVAQRSWESLLLVLAFTGTVRLARRLGVVGLPGQMSAGFAYALAPRMISEIGTISAELMPVAALPWVLAPLVTGARRGDPRRSALASAAALLLAGGVNAAATIAVLPVPVLWLLTRSPGPRRRALAGWWFIGVAAVCMWWAIPLLLLGKYSVPFLNWIEPSAVTTTPTTLVDALRGVTHWESFLGSGVWPGGWIYASAPAVIFATCLIAIVGLVGLARPNVPHAGFLRLTLLLGLILITAGHAATVGPPGADTVRHLLDTSLAAFRNIHKFDPLIRLPLALGLGFAIASMPRSVRWSAVVLPTRTLALLAVACAGTVAITPVLTQDVIPAARATADPVWWQQTGNWLSKNADGGRALVVPGASSPAYFWGSTVDDALQPDATSPWTTRGSVPLAQAGYIRLLDDIERRLASGRADDALAQLLARSGVRYVVVRNDLDAGRSLTTSLTFVHATVDNTPGLVPITSFGPQVGAPPAGFSVVDVGAQRARAAVEIYQVTPWTAPYRLQSAAQVVVSNGSADSLGQLVERGIGPTTPVLFGADASPAVGAGVAVVTEGIRRRENSFGAAPTYSPTMTAAQPYQADRVAHDYLPPDAGRLSTVQYDGIASVAASSSGSDIAAVLNRGIGHGPWSALDGDPNTAWMTGSLSGAVGQWFAVNFPTSRALDAASIAFAGGLGPPPTRIRVTTDRGSLVESVNPVVGPQSIKVPVGSTRSLRITIESVSGGGRGLAVGISQLTLPGVAPTRTLNVGVIGSPSYLAFDIADGRRDECLSILQRAACDPSFAQSGEEDGLLDRSFQLDHDGSYQLGATFRLLPGPQLDQALDRGAAITTAASSTNSADARNRSGAAVDGDPATSWVAAPDDADPTLRLTLPSRQSVPYVDLRTDLGTPAAAPTRVRITTDAGTWLLPVRADGRVMFPNLVVTRHLSIEVVESSYRLTVNSRTFAVGRLPVGISEVAIGGRPNRPSTAPIAIGCDAGVQVMIDGNPVAMRIVGSRADALSGAAVLAEPCAAGSHQLVAGPNRVIVTTTAGLASPETITLARAGARLAAPAPPGQISRVSWGATERRLRVSTDQAAFLDIPENANGGWRATLHGHVLRAVEIDGWQQGWVLPAGSKGILSLTYTPQSVFSAALILGAASAVVVVVSAVLPERSRNRPARRRQAPRAATDVVTRPIVDALITLVAGFLLGSWIGLLIAGAVTAWWWWVPGAPLQLVWSGVGALTAGSMLEVVRPFGRPDPLANSAATQVLLLVGIVALTVASIGDRRQPREKR
jgi:arabinofuranan 3-O-arabinosyltransferase